MRETSVHSGLDDILHLHLRHDMIEDLSVGDIVGAVNGLEARSPALVIGTNLEDRLGKRKPDTKQFLPPMPTKSM